MTDIEFEQLLSYKPVIDRREQPCLRDLIFDHCLVKINSSRVANEKTKVYTDTLYNKFVNRKA